MPSEKKKDLEKSDFIVLQKKLTEKIDRIISPNKLQIGLDSEGFKSDLITKGVLIASGGVTGSLTSLIDGTDYIQGGDNIIITTGSTGFIHISAQTGGGNADREAQYVVMAATASMSSERVLAAGSGIAMTDAGAGGNVTLAINYNDIPSLVSGTDFTAGVKFSSNLHISGNVSSFVLTGAIKGTKFHVSASSTLFDSRVHFSGTISEFIATGSGKFETGLSGSLQKLISGRSYLASGDNITIDSGTADLDGQIVISAPGAGAGGADKAAQFLVLALTASLQNERLFALSDGLKASDGGANGTYLLSINENVVAKVVSGTTFTDNVHLSGSVSDFLLTGSIKGTQTHISSDSVLIDNNLYLSGNVSDFTATGTIKASAGIEVTDSAYFSNPVYLSGSVSDFTATGTIKASAGITVSDDSSFSGDVIFTGDTHLSGNVSDFSLTGTIKNSAAKVIESSVATEIETTAGKLTLDGKAGIDLSENGTPVISIDNSRNVEFANTGDVTFKNTGGSTSDPDVEFDGYVRFDGQAEFDKAVRFDDSVYLSGSVSDFSLTGTIKNSASKVIESSVATEIETRAGTLTLDGASGIDLQHSGSSYIKLNSGSITIGDLSGSNTFGVSPPDIYISGTVQSNLHLSGSVFASKLSGSLTTLTDGTEYLIAGTNVTINTGSSGALTISATTGTADPGGGNTQVQFNDGGSFGGSSAFTFTGTEVELNAESPKYTLRRGGNNQDSKISFEGVAGSVGATITHESGTNDLRFDVFNGSSTEEILRLGDHFGTGNRQVIFLSGSGMGAADMQPRNAIDLAFFVSGSIGSKGTTDKGTSVFGGDTMVSGTLHVSQGISGSLTTLTDGTEYLIAGTNVTINTGSSGALTISATTGTADPGGGNTQVQFNDGGSFGGDSGLTFNKTSNLLTAGKLHITAKTSLSGTVSDFALTGTIKNTASKVIESSVATEIETAAGALTLDGKAGVNLQANGTTVLSIGPAGTYLSSSVSDFSLTGTIKNSASKVIESSVATEIETRAGTLTLDGAAGIDIQYSGSSYIKLNSGSITIGDLSGSNTLGVSPPDIYISGAIQSNLHLSGSVFAGKLSGSLTTLADGSEYLIAGSSITLTTGSTGAITIASTATGGGGADKGAQYVVLSATGSLSNERVLAAGSGLKLTDGGAGSSITVAINPNVVAQLVSGTTFTGNVHLSGSVSDFALTGTIKNSASKVIQSSAATEIETTAGALTLDGKTGINLQANGTTVLSVGPAGTYLSSSVSDFSLTGTIKNSASKVIESSVATEIETKAGALTLDGAAGINLQYSGSTYITLNTGSVYILSGGGATSSPPGVDTAFFVSGAIGSKGSTTKGTSLFGGDMMVSGTLHVSQGISGSLTTLANGSEYMIGGANISIATGSDGALTISAPAVASVAGTDTQVQFNDDDSFGGDAGLTFNKTSNLLSVGKLHVTAKTSLSGTVSDFALTGTIKNSAAKVIESSVATEIETAAGALTLDGKTGVALQANGTQMLAVGPAGVYLSGSVSDFTLTGSIKGTQTLITADSTKINNNIYLSGSVFADKLSGSLTTLADGTSYLNAGSNVTITTGSTGQVTVAVSSTSNVVFNETPGGSINGSNTAFTLANSPEDGTVMLFVNGQLQASGSGIDYTLSNKTLTFSGESVPQTSDRLIATYSKST